MPKKGILFILIATFAFACMNIVAKYLSDFHPLQVVFFRALGTFVFIFPYMLLNKISLLGIDKKFLILRAVAGFLSLSTFFWAVQRIPLGSAISIRYIGPIFAALLSYLFLKEKVTKWQWFSFLISFSGVLLLKGFDLRIDLLSFCLVLFSAFSVGIVFVLLRYLSKTESVFTIINYFMIVCILGSLVSINYWRWPIGVEWYYVTSIGIFGLVGQLLMTKAFSLEETATLAPFKYMELIYALFIGYIFLGETYPIISIVAMALIILGVFVNVYSKKKKTDKEHSTS